MNLHYETVLFLPNSKLLPQFLATSYETIAKQKKNNLFKEEESDGLIAEPSESGFIRPHPRFWQK